MGAAFDRIECYALLKAYGGGVPYLGKIACMLGGADSDDRRSIAIECVVGCQTM